MEAIEIARKLAALGSTEDACDAYSLVIHQKEDPAAELEAAAYILQSGGNYKVSYTCFLDLYQRGHFRDRLGRNYEEILEQWASLTKEKKAAIVVLDMPLLDTREGRDLTGTLIADIVLQLLSYVAQTEREFIRQRQAEGIAAAKERGVRFGRKRIPMPDRFEELALDWWFGYISAVQAGKELGISRSTFTRRAEEWGSSQGLARERYSSASREDSCF